MYIVTSRAEKIFDDSFFKDFKVHISYTGQIHWSFGGVIATGCTLVMTDYPYDEQICTLKVTAWMNNINMVNLTNAIENISTKRFEQHGLWNIKSTSSYRTEEQLGILAYPQVHFAITMTRKAGFYILNIVAPCLLLMWLTLLMFWLPVDSGEKMGFGVTILLAFAVFQLLIAESTPKTSDFAPLLGMYKSTLYCSF